VFQDWRSPLLLDRARQVARRRHLAHLVRYRRAAAHPLAAEPAPQPALRRMHGIDTGPWHAPRPQRHRGQGAILAARARGAALLDIGVGILGKLDRQGLRRNGKAWLFVVFATTSSGRVMTAQLSSW